MEVFFLKEIYWQKPDLLSILKDFSYSKKSWKDKVYTSIVNSKSPHKIQDILRYECDARFFFRYFFPILFHGSSALQEIVISSPHFDPTVTDPCGRSVLEHVILKNDTSLFELILKNIAFFKKSKINQWRINNYFCDFQGKNTLEDMAFDLVIKAKNIDMLKIFLKKGIRGISMEQLKEAGFDDLSHTKEASKIQDIFDCVRSTMAFQKNA